MLHWQTTGGEKFRKIMEVISPIMVDGNITFDKSGVYIEGATSGIHVKLCLPSSGAEAFKSWTDRVSVGLDFKCLAGWLRSVTKGDIISFTLLKKDYESAHPVLIYKHWGGEGGGNHEVRFPILDIEESSPIEFPIQYRSIVTLSSVKFDEYIRRHGGGAKNVRFQSNHAGEQKFFILHSFGNTPGETTKPCFVPNSTGPYKHENKACQKQESFSIKRLKTVAKAHSVSSSVNIHLNEGGALMLSYQLGQLGSLEFRVDPSEEKSPVEKTADPVQPSKVALKRKALTACVLSPKKKRRTKASKKEEAKEAEFTIDNFIDELATEKKDTAETPK